jgi:hypothetical protein
MKKTILTLSMLFLLLSCNKDDDNNNNGNLTINNNTIAGTYIIKEVVKEDGSIVPYTGYCPTVKDTVIIDFTNIFVKSHRVNCTTEDKYTCFGFFLANGKIVTCNKLINGTITEFTNEKLKIMNDEVINGGDQFHGNKGIVLYR